uniref:Uncharacterized protein n=1 Tax=Anguilla anguilla TaxID=7936 RepID=A0A0E9V6C1_ANGAN
MGKIRVHRGHCCCHGYAVREELHTVLMCELCTGQSGV